jgi:uncharacterized DUF497 family protein
VPFRWDTRKCAVNRQKHGIDFADAVAVFEDPCGLTTEDPNHDEERFVTLGMDFFGRVLVVVWTWRGEDIRLIPARGATRRERRQYEREE